MVQPSITDETITTLANCLGRVRQNIALFNGRFPNSGNGTTYTLNDNVNWLAAFWPGLLWLSDAVSNDPIFRETAVSLLPTFYTRLDTQTHITHDLGFLYSLSARAQWQQTGDDAAAQLALVAAAQLWKRYRRPGHYIQAWGPVGDAEKGGLIIADTMMNLPLLFWASEQTGDDRYHEAAYHHAQNSRQFLIREDGSSFHTYFFNQETGEPLKGSTHQGFAEDSCWARGHAWLIYGFALAAQWCDDPQFLEAAKQTAVFFLNNLPADNIPLWDFRLSHDELAYRDSSAAAIAACGLLRIAAITGDETFRAQGNLLIDALIHECLETNPAGQGLLKHGALHIPKGWAPDDYLIFGDYFFLEALLTRKNKNPDFWGPTKKE
ncbi:MAG: glycoside hydrolase family 88 protein [Anaerolineae bacterium]|nr:glycoside hydrolase family 88 protein [Anaerolineae bacterium]